MKNNYSKIATFVVLLTGLFGSAQINQSFKPRFQKLVQGDMVVIANSIVNRQDKRNSPNTELNDLSKSADNNDEYNMRYIDVDSDPSTFSSSSATVKFNDKNTKRIVYAALYWSATYKSNESELKFNKYILTDSKREDYTKVKIKLPDTDKYVPVSGQVLFDGYKDPMTKEYAPYTCYADITPLFTDFANYEGVYTVANIYATQGKVAGGVAGGWTLFLVYEEEELTEKFISTYDGFVGVTERYTDVKFSGFKSVIEGEIKAKLVASALEGDNNLVGDQLLMAGKNKKFFNLKNAIRESDNFFNGTITIEDDFLNGRTPNSTNTLGYDTCLLSIPNINNNLIDNATSQLTLRLQSNGDRYFMFFTAFNVEVSPPRPIIYTESEIIAKKAALNASTTLPNVAVNTTPITKNKTTDNADNTEVKTPPTPAPDRDRTLVSNAIPKGFYLVANVFAVPENAIKFAESLKQKGIPAKYVVNPETKYHYVYLNYSTNEEQIRALKKSGFNYKYSDYLWLLIVK
jgi:cell division septation protein DedD